METVPTQDAVQLASALGAARLEGERQTRFSPRIEQPACPSSRPVDPIFWFLAEGCRSILHISRLVPEGFFVHAAGSQTESPLISLQDCIASGFCLLLQSTW